MFWSILAMKGCTARTNFNDAFAEDTHNDCIKLQMSESLIFFGAVLRVEMLYFNDD